MIPTPLKNAECLFLTKENQAKVGYAALAVVEADRLIPLCKDFLAAGYHLEDVSGMVSADGAVSMYHFAHFDIPGRAALMVVAPLDAPSFPSIASVYQGAEWHERETRDFFGFNYENNPNFIPLLLAETMADVHPLLKEEGNLASLSTIFSAPGREREVVKQADGFTLLDVPEKEEAAPKEAPVAEVKTEPVPAVKPEPKPEPVAEVKAEPVPTVKPEPKPEPVVEVKAQAKAKVAPKAEPVKKTASAKAEVKVKVSPQPSGKKAASGKKGDSNA